MADGKFLIGKPAGGVTTVTMTDGVDNTNLVLPESGTVATEAYADGKTTLTQVKAEISTGSNLVTSPAGAIGYGVGSGGTVTQLTSKTTAVTLNKPTGRIIMNGAALPNSGYVGFALNNTAFSSNDNIIVNASGGAYDISAYEVRAVYFSANTAAIYVKNISGGSLSEALQINFTIIKGANS